MTSFGLGLFEHFSSIIHEFFHEFSARKMLGSKFCKTAQNCSKNCSKKNPLLEIARNVKKRSKNHRAQKYKTLLLRVYE